MRLKKIIVTKIVLLLLMIPARWFGQDLLASGKNVGFNVGLNLGIGSHFQRLGVNLNFFYTNHFFQANSEVRAYFSFKNLGPPIKYPELVLSQGLVFGYGAKQNFFNPFLNPVSNQTGYLNAFAYAYNVYINKIKTAQQTGTIAFQFNTITIIAENDILGHTYYDRFRTGAFLVQYQYRDKFQAAVNCTMWTGQMGRSVRDGQNYPAICYMDTTHGRYTNYSHGLLSAQVKYNLGYSQNVQVSLGADAEQVRNTVQNRLIHDLVFIPRKWIKPKNCHIPMLDDHGNEYLYRPGQKIKPAKLYLNLYSNAGLFY